MGIPCVPSVGSRVVPEGAATHQPHIFQTKLPGPPSDGVHGVSPEVRTHGRSWQRSVRTKCTSINTALLTAQRGLRFLSHVRFCEFAAEPPTFGWFHVDTCEPGQADTFQGKRPCRKRPVPDSSPRTCAPPAAPAPALCPGCPSHRPVQFLLKNGHNTLPPQFFNLFFFLLCACGSKAKQPTNLGGPRGVTASLDPGH